MVESISHCVHSVDTNTVLPHTTKLLASLPDLSPHQVSVQWLVESLKLGRPAPESDFTFPALTAREDPAQSASEQSDLSLPPLVPLSALAKQVKAGTGGDDTTQFDRELLAQFGTRGGNITRTKSGNIHPPLHVSVCLYLLYCR